MANIIIPKPWKRLKPVDENIYNNRRQFIKDLGLSAAGILAAPLALSACTNSEKTLYQQDIVSASFDFPGMNELYPAHRNSTYTIKRPMTDEYDATHYNNFYEFISPDDSNIYNTYKYVDRFDTSNWIIEVKGLASKTGLFELSSWIKKFGLEERVYRFRCVERWSMAVPWTGFSLKKLIDWLEPDNKATHVRFVSKSDPSQMPGVKHQSWYPWPYYEGLSIEEARNELSLLATGIFGKALPKQNGAPLRLIVPWKYGYKNPKSIVSIEFLDHEPETFWHKLSPKEYGFISNVDPAVPHPRWSQQIERMIPDGEERPTLEYNGYGKYVAHLY